jgi:hypothetical protein
MFMKKVILLMLIVTTIPGLLKAQQKKVATGQLSVAPLYPLVIKNKLTLSSPVFASIFSSAQLPVTPKAKSPVGPRDYYQQSFGYFCKREWNWEKQTKVPVKFRLGSYQEAQRIEGKQ